MMKDVLTTASAAELLGVSVRTAQLWVESGQLPSWKTPGGHRRIPRQAVLDLIEETPQDPVNLAAHAVILAGTGRGEDWQKVGLPGAGLLVYAEEDVEPFLRRLHLAAPTLIIVEGAEEPERRKLAGKVASDPRYRQSLIVTMMEKRGEQAAARGAKRAQLQMLPDVSATSAKVIDYLKETQKGMDDAPSFGVPLNEQARLEAVERSALVGSAADSRFDRLVRLAAYVTKAPIAMFTLIMKDQQWFKSKVGFDGENTSRDWAFCNETLVANEFTVVEDLTRDEIYKENPTLQDPYGFRFYAGAPVRDPLGFALGSVCVIDVVPRVLKDEEREALITIADAISNLIRLMVLEGGDQARLSQALDLAPLPI
jgi:excisionase family DNA binding protein